MKILMNLIVSITLPFTMINQGVAETTIVENNDLEYCNERYDFCISYPDDVFTGTALADNGDGITLYENVEEVEVKVFGAYNVMNWSLEDIYYFTFEDFVHEEKEVKHLERHFEDEAFETAFVVDGRLHYYKIYLLDDTYVSVSIVLPDTAMETLDKLKENLVFSVTV